MIRVCCTVGTWQLITLVASLAQADQEQPSPDLHDDYLIVAEYGGVPDEFKNLLHRMAQAAWPWKRIVWAYELLTAERHLSQREFDRRRAALREKIGLSQEPDEVWTCFLNRPPEKLMFSAYPAASLVLYEDGLGSYLPQEIARRFDPARDNLFRRHVGLSPWAVIEKVQPVWRFRRSKWDIDPHHLARLVRAYYLLTPEIRPPDVFANIPLPSVKPRHVREVLERIAPLLSGEDVSSAAGAILVLGQGLSRNHIISRHEELDLCGRTLETILAKGYNVLWKEHPRTSEPLFDDVRSALGASAHRVTRLTAPHAFPIELLVPHLRLAGCVAGLSTALFYLRRLYDLPCYTFAQALMPLLPGRDQMLCQMVAAHIPPLSDLPDASDAPVLLSDAKGAFC